MGGGGGDGYISGKYTRMGSITITVTREGSQYTVKGLALVQYSSVNNNTPDTDKHCSGMIQSDSYMDHGGYLSPDNVFQNSNAQLVVRERPDIITAEGSVLQLCSGVQVESEYGEHGAQVIWIREQFVYLDCRLMLSSIRSSGVNISGWL